MSTNDSPLTTLGIRCAARISSASAQNAVPILQAIEIRHAGEVPIENLTLRLRAQPPFCHARSLHIDRVDATLPVSVADLDLMLDFGLLAGLNEAEHGELIATLTDGEETIAEQTAPIELLARDQWGGLDEMAGLLAAFVLPNDPAVPPLLKQAAGLLEQAGHSGALDGYQDAEPARAYLQAAAIWSAVTGMGLNYAQPPASFERIGQKVRDPGRIANEGLATCLDGVLLFDAALEAAALRPVAIFTEGHAFAGVWLVDRGFDNLVEPDITELRKAIAAHELIVFETTLVTERPVVGFEQAVEHGKAQLNEAREAEFDRAVDIRRARAAGIRPLASHRERPEPSANAAEVRPAALPPMPDFDLLPGEQADRAPATPAGRIARWQRKLLDLSLRNRLLNFVDSKQTLAFVCPDVARLEDLLAEGKKLKIISLPDEDLVSRRDPELYRRQTGQAITADFALQALERGQVCAAVPGGEMAARLTTLYRKARSDLAEGGTNTLFLAAGFLRWRKRPDDRRVYRAPLLLLPVTLVRRSSRSPFYLAEHEDEPRINATLLQFLERDFDLRLPLGDAELPLDQAGIDLAQLFATLRRAVHDAPGFEVVEELALSTFSFAKYLMWKDLVDRTDSLRRNRLVRHLIDSPETPFITGGRPFPRPEDIDRRVDPADLLTPLAADSSQLAAVVAAGEGHDFVVVGPPGTGKSQTIANMIAHCLARGRTVLFVAEKAAALDVVHRRLKAYGLADACLELHSNKADRRSVIAQLGRAWDRSARDNRDEWVQVTAALKVHRDQLNGYVEALHARQSPGFSIFEAIGDAIGTAPVLALRFPSHDAHDEDAFRALTALAAELGRTYAAARDCRAVRFIARGDWSYGWQAELLARTEALRQRIALLTSAAAALAAALELPRQPSLSAACYAALARLTDLLGRSPTPDLRFAFAGAFDELVAARAPLAQALADIRARRPALAADYADAEIPRIPVDDLDRAWREAATRIWPASALARRRVRKLLATYATAGKADPAGDLPLLRALGTALAVVAESPLRRLPAFAGVATDLDRLDAELADAAALRRVHADLLRLEADRALVPDRLMALAGGDAAPAEAMQQLHMFAAEKARYEVAGAALTEHAGGLPSGAPDELAQALIAVRAEQGRIADWSKWIGVRARAIEAGLEPLVQAVESDQIDDAETALRIAYLHWWLPLALDAHPTLRAFAHWEHQDRIERFRALDAATQRLAAAQVRHAVSHDLPERAGVPRRSELGVLRHQLGLRRPSVSIRQLIAQMPETLPRLAPCMLMSPLSVAQYLPSDQAPFDIIIFDEASQITTWDAIGAIARGEQSIIVGDPKQLPPTNFFGRSNDDDEMEIELHEQDLPSILDEATAAGLTTHQLNWHYRSRDEALIAFSNRHYYGNRLVTFPSPSTGSQALRLDRVDGTYARGAGRTNPIEAQAVVAMIVARLTDWLALPEPKRPTLGVITFNVQQQELILDLLDVARREDPTLEWFFGDERDEPVIVKNLENIQGDERDLMLFSTTFGPDFNGKLTMNFGPLNGDGGERRLNVAITRARSEMHLFTSIGSDRIDLSRTRAIGVAHLKGFLDYAARGAETLALAGQATPKASPSRFVAAVARALGERGWTARTRIGVSGLRIDLGVVHPERADTYLAGIECDGPSYRAAAAARDRDGIRAEMLGRLGWALLRVWSTDWYRAPNDACERLDADLRGLLRSPCGDPMVAAQQSAGAAES